MKKPKALLINGPNLNMLGKRQPEVYGTESLSEIIASVGAIAQESGWILQSFQSNSESDLIAFTQEQFEVLQSERIEGVILNPAALTHTSIALRDAIEMLTAAGTILVEVHLSNVFRRESFRHHSYFSPLADAVITGLESEGYRSAIRYLVTKCSKKQ